MAATAAEPITPDIADTFLFSDLGGISQNGALIPGASGADQRWMVPDIIEFCVSDKYLNKPSLFPRQATLLKTIFLQDELFTEYDYDVLGEWSAGFTLPREMSVQEGGVGDVTTKHFVGEWGINPDILYRIKWMKDRGYPWFSIVLAVQGRRSGKGHIGGIAGAYVLWNYICASDPKALYGIDPTKRLACQVFAGKKAQARDNQWRDIANTILEAPCFDTFRGTSLVESLTMQTPMDSSRKKALDARSVDTAMDLSTFEFVPKEATTMAARGPASFMQYYDEMAHMVNTGVSRSAEEVWNSASPALDQFKKDAFVYCGSSPWTMMGKFYDLVQESLEVDAVSIEAINPTILTLQLASWDIYLDWEKTANRDFLLAPAWYKSAPDGARGKAIPPIYAQPLKSAISEYDDKMRREERLNPVTFGVERRAKWATAQDSYFDKMHIDRGFMNWNGIEMRQLDVGQPGVHDYYAHADPGKTSSNFGFAIAHLVPDPDGDPIPHVVFDRIHGFMPGDFPTGEGHDIHYEMDYIAIEEQIKVWYEGFLFTDLSFDQWNSISFVQRLQQYGRRISYKPTSVWERTTTAPVNWATAETMKLALSLNRIHMPYNELAELELKFLRKLPSDKVDHPDTGPVTTKDVYDAISIVVHKLLGAQISAIYGDQFMALRMSGGMPGAVAMASQGHPSAPGQGGTNRPISDPSVQNLFRRDLSPSQRVDSRSKRR